MDNTKELDTEYFTEFKINEKKQNEKEVTSTPFWFDNPNILLDKNYIFEFFPIEPMSYNQKLNAITRIIIGAIIQLLDSILLLECPVQWIDLL